MTLAADGPPDAEAARAALVVLNPDNRPSSDATRDAVGGLRNAAERAEPHLRTLIGRAVGLRLVAESGDNLLVPAAHAGGKSFAFTPAETGVTWAAVAAGDVDPAHRI